MSIGEGWKIDLQIESFAFRLSFIFATTDQHCDRITAEAASIRLSISRSILP